MRFSFKEWLNGPTAIVAGVHGDEDAPVEAMRKLTNKPDNFIFVTRANPTALDKGTRRGADNKDLNRQFCDLTPQAKKLWEEVKECKLLVTLHEWDNTGAFAYFGGDRAKGIAKQFVDTASKTFGVAKPNEDHIKSMKNGLIDHEDIKHLGRTKCSFETYAWDRGIEYVTTETPMQEKFDERVRVYLEFLQWLVKG